MENKINMFPPIDSQWLHTNGSTYTVMHCANRDSDRPDYPPTVVYRNTHGKIYVKPLSTWYRSRTLIDSPITQPLIAEAARDDASADECIELAQALEQARAVKIAEFVAALPIGGATNNMPTPFQAGFQLACEEITHRLRTEEWDLCLKPIDADIAAVKLDTAPTFNQAEFDTMVEKGTKAWAGHAIKRDDVAGDAMRIDWIESQIQRTGSVWFLPCGEELRFIQVRHCGETTNYPTVAGLRKAIDSAIATSTKDAQ